MKRYHKFLLIVLIAVFGAVISDAATFFRETRTFSGLTDYNEALTFNQFDSSTDPTFIELTGISVFYTINITNPGSLFADNESASASSGSVSFGVDGLITSSDVTLPGPLNLAKSSSDTFNLEADEASDGPVGDFEGPDSASISGPTGTETDTGEVSEINWGAYLGTGTFDIFSDVSELRQVTGLGGASFLSTASTVSTTITVQYDYAAIPEPATLSFFLVGFSAIAWVRRRNREIKD